MVTKTENPLIPSNSKQNNTYYNTGTVFYITFSPPSTEVTVSKYLWPPSPPSRNRQLFQTWTTGNYDFKTTIILCVSPFQSTQRQPWAISVLAWQIIINISNKSLHYSLKAETHSKVKHSFITSHIQNTALHLEQTLFWNNNWTEMLLEVSH